MKSQKKKIKNNNSDRRPQKKIFKSLRSSIRRPKKALRNQKASVVKLHMIRLSQSISHFFNTRSSVMICIRKFIYSSQKAQALDRRSLKEFNLKIHVLSGGFLKRESFVKESLKNTLKNRRFSVRNFLNIFQRIPRNPPKKPSQKSMIFGLGVSLKFSKEIQELRSEVQSVSKSLKVFHKKSICFGQEDEKFPLKYLMFFYKFRGKIFSSFSKFLIYF